MAYLHLISSFLGISLNLLSVTCSSFYTLDFSAFPSVLGFISFCFLPYHFNMVSEEKITYAKSAILPNQTVRYECRINIIKYVRVLTFHLPRTISKEVTRGYTPSREEI